MQINAKQRKSTQIYDNASNFRENFRKLLQIPANSCTTEELPSPKYKPRTRGCPRPGTHRESVSWGYNPSGLRIVSGWLKSSAVRGRMAAKEPNHAPPLAVTPKLWPTVPPPCSLLPKRLPPHRVLAWLQATCPDKKYRDGSKALDNAKRADDLDGRKNWQCCCTLAAAYAETHDFAKACQWQSKAVELAKTDKAATAKEREKMRLQFESYQANKAYRDEPKVR